VIFYVRFCDKLSAAAAAAVNGTDNDDDNDDDDDGDYKLFDRRLASSPPVKRYNTQHYSHRSQCTDRGFVTITSPVMLVLVLVLGLGGQVLVSITAPRMLCSFIMCPSDVPD